MLGDDNMYTSEEILALKNTTMIIYEVRNMINNKVYIGQTARSFNARYGGTGVGAERILGHHEKSGVSNKHLHRALKKYGTDNFKVSILKQCSSKQELDEMEIYYINLYDSTNSSKGYNRAAGGHSGGRCRWDFYDYASQQYLWFGEYTLDYFEKLIEDGYDKMILADELFRKSVVVEKTWGDTKKYFLYNSARELVRDNRKRYCLKDVFIVCKYTSGCKEKWCRLGKTKIPSQTKMYFAENIKLTKDIKFENIGADINGKGDEMREIEKAKKEREKLKAKERKEKYNAGKEPNSKGCRICGKRIVGTSSICADCNIKETHEKNKLKAISQGKEIKTCPICGKEHWRQVSTCSRGCNVRYKRRHAK